MFSTAALCIVRLLYVYTSIVCTLRLLYTNYVAVRILRLLCTYTDRGTYYVCSMHITSDSIFIVRLLYVHYVYCMHITSALCLVRLLFVYNVCSMYITFVLCT